MTKISVVENLKALAAFLFVVFVAGLIFLVPYKFGFEAGVLRAWEEGYYAGSTDQWRYFTARRYEVVGPAPREADL